MDKLDILTKLFDDKVIRILRIFYDSHDKEFYLRELSRAARVPVATCHRIVAKLITLELVEVVHVRKFRLFKLGDNEYTRFLGQLIRTEKQALEVFVTRAKELEGLDSALLQGEEGKNSANVILIGENIDQNEIKKLCAVVREQFSFNITALILAKEQFEQMDKMGLYPGKKRVLYTR